MEVSMKMKKLKNKKNKKMLLWRPHQGYEGNNLQASKGERVWTCIPSKRMATELARSPQRLPIKEKNPKVEELIGAVPAGRTNMEMTKQKGEGEVLFLGR